MSNRISDSFRYIRKLVVFAFSMNRLLFLSMVLSIFSVSIEVLAMGSLYPLSVLAAGNPLPTGDFFVRLVSIVGLQLNNATFLMAFVTLFSLRVVTQLAAQGLSVYAGKRVQAQLSADAFGIIVQKYGLREIEQKSIGHFISIAGDETSRAGAIVTAINQFIGLALLAILYFIAIIYYSVAVGIAVLIFLTVSLLSLAGAFKKSHQLGERQLAQAKVAHSIFLDSLNGLRSVRALSAEAHVERNYRKVIFDYTRTLFQIDFLNLAAKLLPILILLGTFGVFVATGLVRLSIDNFAFVVTILILLLRFFPTVGQCLTIFLRIVSDAKAGMDVTEVVETGKVSDSDIGKFVRLSQATSRIEIRDASFSFDGKKKIFSSINAQFVAGRSYAIVGPSGCGKSTLMDLMLKFYAVDGGDILINGESLSKIDEREVRKRIVLVSQQTSIFNDTVYNNVAFGRQIDVDSMRTACKLASIDEFIMSLSKGYDTVLTYQGSNLSGGQRQRIGLARALLRQPDVLILDESTSALDGETRDLVIQNLLSEYRQRIIIFIAHDHSITSRVDEVIELRKGGQRHAYRNSASA